MSDILQEAENLLVQLPEAVTRRKLGQRLGQTADDLKNADDQIARMKALLETVVLVGYGQLPQQREVIEEMVDWARTVGRSLEAAEEAEALRSAAFDYKDSLNKAIVALDRAISQHWRSEATDKFQPLIGLGELLSAMNVPNNLGARLMECGRTGLASTNYGSAIQRLHNIRQLLADHQTLQEERANEIGNDEVGEFINALADNRATLAMVTPQVHAWLVDHHALGSLGVTTRLRGSAGAVSG